jgi:hypothetical protein
LAISGKGVALIGDKVALLGYHSTWDKPPQRLGDLLAAHDNGAVWLGHLHGMNSATARLRRQSAMKAEKRSLLSCPLRGRGEVERAV